MDEKVRGGKIQLQIRDNPSGPQGTPNKLIDRKKRGRPRKDIQDKPAQTPALPQINEVEQEAQQVPAQEPPADNTQQVPAQETPADNAQQVPTQKPPTDDEYAPSESSSPPRKRKRTNHRGAEKAQQQPATVKDTPEEDTPAADLSPLVEGQLGEEKPARYFFRSNKRKRDGLDDQADEHHAKVLKAMLAMIYQHSEGEDTQHAYVASSIPKEAFQTSTPAVRNIIFKAFHAAATNLLEHADDIALPASHVKGIQIPTTYKQAIADKEYGDKWRAAVQEEIHQLVLNGTWKEFILPVGANLIDTKWVFAIKLKVDGTIERFKARLVARGFSQEHGSDYTETFAPTVRMDTLRLFLAMVARRNMECRQWDIKNAFTESRLKEDIYLAPPQGVTVTKGKVLKALRSLYGLKQAGRDWNQLYKKFLLKNGFTQSLADPCLFIHTGKGIYLLVYVDDIIGAADDNSSLDWFERVQSSRFTAKALGEISMILGVRVTRNRETREIFLDQENYLDTKLTELGIPKAKYKPAKIPAADYEHLRPATADEERIDAGEYSKTVGTFMYAMVMTRPDIAFVLGRLAQYMSDPAVFHGHALKNLMRYLRSTVSQKLRFGPGGAHEATFGVYTDADWASDKTDRKSISGGVGMYYGGPYSWAAKKQRSVATSSAESEYMSQAMYAKQGQWTAQIFRDLGMPECVNTNGETVQMFGDNQGAIALTKNPQLHERSKHIDICYHFIRDLAEQKKLDIQYIPTEEMVADGMTKPLARVAFERFKKQLGVVGGA